MKSLVSLLLFFVVSFYSNAQIVDIPDTNFKAALIAQGVDTNSDGEIQVTEAESRTDLSLFNNNISDLTGISSFINLVSLNLANNQLTTLDLTSLNNLQDLSCPNNQLTTLDLTGLNNLEYLDCYNNQLTELNLTGITSLLGLSCQNNQLASLNIANNALLYSLYCNDNQLTELNVSGLSNLSQLQCYNNLMTSLTVDGLNNLYELMCDNNQLTSLSITNSPLLSSLDCSDNQLTSLSITNSPLLFSLDCYDNQLTTLDVSSSNNLLYLNCDNNLLTSLNLPDNNFNGSVMCNNNSLETIDFTGFSDIDIDCHSNNISSFIFPEGAIISNIYAESNQIVNLDLSNVDDIGVIVLNNNPVQTINIKNGVLDNFNLSAIHLDLYEESQLEFVCVDEEELVDVADYFSTSSYSDVVVNPYCSYTPGGTYNTITGTMLLDSNNNGCDMADIPMPNALVEVSDGTNEALTFVNASGNYFYYDLEGTFILTPIIENSDWFTISPSSATIPFADDNDNIVTQDFCVTANGTHNDIEIIIVPIIPAQPGFNATYQIVYKNKGNQIISGDINFVFDDAVLDFVSSSVSPDSQTISNLLWNYTDLLPFESRSIEVTLNVNSPMESPAVNIGDQLDFDVTINPISGDEVPSDNVFGYKQIVIGSYDPNDITCLEGETVSPDKIGEYLHYNINFENTGTAAATFVVVKNLIDELNYDISSIQIMYASHVMQTRIVDNTIEFIFDNINLGPNEKGNVVYKIKTEDTLSVGDSVENKAEIFFDYNFPIETNIAITSYQVLSIDDFEINNAISVYPNPTNDIINISSKSLITSIKIYDALGPEVFMKSYNDNATSIDITDYADGIYYIRFITELGESVKQLVKN